MYTWRPQFVGDFVQQNVFVVKQLLFLDAFWYHIDVHFVMEYVEYATMDKTEKWYEKR